MYEGIQITSESDDLCTILKIVCSLTFYFCIGAFLKGDGKIYNKENRDKIIKYLF